MKINDSFGSEDMDVEAEVSPANVKIDFNEGIFSNGMNVSNVTATALDAS